uniref:PTBP1-like RNA recognition motif 2 domain-containing protein n=1 Tax=Leersia perrieri TaxID=77586 RepID=A0A0D9XZQ3_9ORYZ
MALHAGGRHLLLPLRRVPQPQPWTHARSHLISSASKPKTPPPPSPPPLPPPPVVAPSSAAAFVPPSSRRGGAVGAGVVAWYLGSIEARPVLTKSVTAAAIFTVADLSSQIDMHQIRTRVEPSVQFRSPADAEYARNTLHGRNIYDGCCRMDFHLGSQIPTTSENLSSTSSNISLATPLSQTIEKLRLQFQKLEVMVKEMVVEECARQIVTKEEMTPSAASPSIQLSSSMLSWWSKR